MSKPTNNILCSSYAPEKIKMSKPPDSTDTIILDELIIPITVDYLEEDGVYMVSCSALQGCRAWGDTLDEAIQAIPDNIRAMLEVRRENGSPIPPLFEQIQPHTPFILRMVPA
jgi:predicted RNase H-like HicB family nuclease